MSNYPPGYYKVLIDVWEIIYWDGEYSYHRAEKMKVPPDCYRACNGMVDLDPPEPPKEHKLYKPQGGYKPSIEYLKQQVKIMQDEIDDSCN